MDRSEASLTRLSAYSVLWRRTHRSAQPTDPPIAPLSHPEHGGTRSVTLRGVPTIEMGWVMYARSTSIRARKDHVEVGIGHVRDEVMPMVLEMDGCIGMSMLVDRLGGRCIATSAWRDEASMRASDEALRPMRDRLSVLVAGGQPEIEEWEIAILHRDHTSRPGACVRATWVQLDPAGLDRAIEVYRSTLLPAAEGLDGFCSASLLMDRSTGRAVSSVTFDSQEALERSRERAASIRESVTREMDAGVLDICEFELAVAHLRVPEMV